MRQWIFSLTFLALVAAASGCRLQAPPDPFETLPHREDLYDLDFAWQTTPTPSGLEVRGAIRNDRYGLVDDLVLYVSLLDRGDRELARETFLPVPSPMRLDEWLPFQVTLRGEVPPGAKLRFHYQYHALDGRDGLRWRNSFEADLATGEVLRKE